MGRESRGALARREKHFRNDFQQSFGVSNSNGWWWPSVEGEYSVPVPVLCAERNQATMPRQDRTRDLVGDALGSLDDDVETIERVLARATPEQLAAELLGRTGQVTPTQQARREADGDKEGQDPGEAALP